MLRRFSKRQTVLTGGLLLGPVGANMERDGERIQESPVPRPERGGFVLCIH